jgi:hypothetical protein
MVTIVGKSRVKDKITQKLRACRYSDIPTDEFRWVHDLSYLPIPYDLMVLKLEGRMKHKGGWWNGKTWEGRQLKPLDKVIAWKRNYDFY